ncbi:MAG: hypothetical protein JXQ29_16415 [Planctomycetes bacterium]|nr:hypothetical protein [Planctomycetota bacterium]
MSDNLPMRPAETGLALMLVDPERLKNAMALAQILAGAKLVPAHFRDNPGDCLRAVDLAMRTRQSPFAIMDKTYVVSGKIAFEGQLCAALLNASGELTTRLSYVYGNEASPAKREGLFCIVSATLAGESAPREVRVTWKQGYGSAKGAKDKWESQPEQQLAYYGARVWGRRHAPQVLLGMYTPEELEGAEPEVREVEVEIQAPPAVAVESVTREQDDSRIAPAPAPEAPAAGNGTISTGQVGHLWSAARARAATLGYGREEAEGIVRDVLQRHDVQPHPEHPDAGPSTRMIPADAFQAVLADIEAWTADAADPQA